MIIEDFFTYQNYVATEKKIKNKNIFSDTFSNKKVFVSIEQVKVDEKIWKDGLMVLFSVKYGNNIFSVPMERNKIKSYKDMISEITNFIKSVKSKLED